MLERNIDAIISVKTGSKSSIGIITLNRPKALNAINYNMIQAMTAALLTWQYDDNIAAVVIKGDNARAFCAGGDVKLLYQNGRTNIDKCMQFFYDEYRLNTLIKHYPKPYVALINGITMGGGIGVSLHGSHVVAAHDLALAMPESSIGFFTDIGASYFLSRCPDYTGYYMGLTGDKISCNDAKHIGLVSNIIGKPEYQSVFNQITEDLTQSSFTKNKIADDKLVASILAQYSADKYLDIGNSKNEISSNILWIKNTFNALNIDQLYSNLEQLNNEWSHKIIAILNAKSPTSLLLIIELLHRGSKLSFDKCLQMEYALAYGFLKNDDFYEGVRALLIDKDNKPIWANIKLNAYKNFNYNEYFDQSKAEELDLTELYS